MLNETSHDILNCIGAFHATIWGVKGTKLADHL